jgi:CheY-like chemotaxis protein
MNSNGLVVLVDDEEQILCLNKKLFESWGYEVRTAADGAIAAELIIGLCHEGHAPLLIVSDMLMPHVSGLEMARILSQDQIAGSIPIIFISGDLGGNDPRDLEPFGGHRLEKPFNFGDLRRMVHEILYGSAEATKA